MACGLVSGQSCSSEWGVEGSQRVQPPGVLLLDAGMGQTHQQGPAEPQGTLLGPHPP